MSVDNFNFKLIGDEKTPFSGYNSCTDKTKVSPASLIRGSYNVYKKRSGTIANRPGLKRRGAVDSTEAGVKSSFEFVNSRGVSLPIRVANNKLQVESDIVTDGTYVWYDLLETSTLLNPARSLTRFSFSPWWEVNEQKDRLVMVRGDTNALHWSGGIAKVASVGSVSGAILTAVVGSGGSGWVAGDIGKELAIDHGGGSRIIITSVGGGAVVSFTLLDRSSGNTAGTHATINAESGITGTGLTVTITVGTAYNITKSGTDTWAQVGFATWITAEKRIVIGGVEYAYMSGEDTTTLQGITTDTSAIPVDSVVIQSVFVASLVGEIPDVDFVADFIAVVENHACYGSYTSKVIHLSTNFSSGTVEVNQQLGFYDLYAGTNDLVTGDPDFANLDDVANGFIVRQGKLYVSAGASDWYEITPDFVPSLSIPFYHDVASGSEAYVITKVEKKRGSGNTGLLAHEFIDVKGDYIYYLGKDHQLHVIGSFSNIEGTQFPVVSQEVYEELQEETFTDGHLRAIEDIIYITAPTTGRHWMLQVRDAVREDGAIVTEKVWYPPHVSGVSRFADIEGEVYGHSNSNPMLFQIWDTGQWYDDAADGTELAYNSVARLAYRNHGDRFMLKSFSKVAIEGYLDYGTQLYGNIYYEYQGSKQIKGFEIHTDDDTAKLFVGSTQISIGGSPLGADPLGLGPISESNDQELLPKFRKIKSVPLVNCHEYAIELLSNEARSRWEVLCLGTDVNEAPMNPTNLKNNL